MWGPRIRFRRWLRPLPTVGWVFLLRWDYGSVVPPLQWRAYETIPGRTGKERDLVIPVENYEAARKTAKRLMAKTLKPGAKIVAVRAADRRDIPEEWDGPRLGPRRHFGFIIPWYRSWEMLS